MPADDKEPMIPNIHERSIDRLYDGLAEMRTIRIVSPYYHTAQVMIREFTDELYKRGCDPYHRPRKEV